MINFKLDIKNIFKRCDTYECIRPKNWYHRLPFERSIEIDYGRIDNTLLTIGLSTRFTGKDHAGPEIKLSIFGYGVLISFPKGRHWNRKKNCWLENYNVWMKSVEELFDSNPKLEDYEFNEHDFLTYYEDGDSPEEAIGNFYEEHCLSDEIYYHQNNPVEDYHE